MTTQQLTVAPDGTTTFGGRGTTWGRSVASGNRCRRDRPASGGPHVPTGNAATLTSVAGSPLYSPINLYQYVPIYDEQRHRCSWFDYHRIRLRTVDSADGDNLDADEGAIGTATGGLWNVSGAFIPGLPQDTTDYTDAVHHARDRSPANPLYAPVLVNHYIGPTP